MVPKAPLLAATIESPDDLANLQFPVLVSEKKDGIRAITDGGGVLSRKLKRIPNRHINLLLSGLPAGIEGELICSDDFEDTESAVMSRDGDPSFQFHVFDWFHKTKFESYKQRIQNLQEKCDNYEPADCFVIKQHFCRDIQTVKNWHHRYVNEKGAEGIMIRDPHGFYKFGRSTLNEQLLIKWKPWNTDEATVISVIEEMENNNPQTRDNLGKAKRSKHIANLQGKGTMGALLCKNKKFGEFKLGSGFNDELAQMIWDRRNTKAFELKAVGVQFRYRGITKYGKPKHASFIRWMN